MSPRASYRVQFHKAFPFTAAIPLASYFGQLGISHLYASPILAARSGSTHGYDVIDHTRINPELGGEEDFRRLVAALRENRLGVIVDIVPNHMAVGGSDNPWWLDVLENGQASPYSAMFDIDWDPRDASLRGRVLAPVLGKALDEAVAAGDIALIWDEALGKLAFAYAEHRFPLRHEDYAEVTGGADDARRANLEAWNRPAALEALLARQHYRLAPWQTAPEAINWRRFFDIIELAALRIEDERVFEAVHAKLFQLYAEGLIDGVRVDHVDGLTDPRVYCRRLRARLDALAAQRPADAPAGPGYLVVEKILASGEQLPADWGVDGTTGYDFMNEVSALQHDANGETPLTKLWTAISGRPGDFETEEREARRELLHASFERPLRTVAAAFHRLALFAAREMREDILQAALGLVLEHLRAYRTYATGDCAEPPAGAQFEAALTAARNDMHEDPEGAFDFIAMTMRGGLAEFGMIAHEAVRQFNQLAAPVAAKAVEDTALFRYGRLISRNDVGFDPRTFALPTAAFEENARRRRDAFPHALLATATHDHKRGEDVRARLAVLSENAREWEAEARRWFALNARLHGPEIDPGDEYQLYQTLMGTWPADFAAEGDGLPAYVERILLWREKSLREAKLRTSWTAPDARFEEANAAFVRALLDPAQSSDFLERLSSFVGRIGPAGALNGLAQCVLKCTLPGVPDFYQGTEFWDFSLTDPDNRRDVDFAARIAALSLAGKPAALLAQWRDGRVKQALIARLLSLRASEPACFAEGQYLPLTVQGPRAGNVVAFMRHQGATAILTAVARHCAEACAATGLPRPDAEFWNGTKIILPGWHCAWQSALDPEVVIPPQSEFGCAVLFADFPAAVLHSTAPHPDR
jgi:(1->4)-alpha-D-glucan 1-alpha-D-glucosylmutase